MSPFWNGMPAWPAPSRWHSTVMDLRSSPLMSDLPPTEEQLRRLKNTVMGASYRLSQLAQSGDLHAGASTELASITRDLEEAAGRLERLLARIQRDRERVGVGGTEGKTRGRGGAGDGERRRA